MPRPETGKFAIALRVSGPYSSLIGSSSDGVSLGTLHPHRKGRSTGTYPPLVILLVAATDQ